MVRDEIGVDLVLSTRVHGNFGLVDRIFQLTLRLVQVRIVLAIVVPEIPEIQIDLMLILWTHRLVVVNLRL